MQRLSSRNVVSQLPAESPGKDHGNDRTDKENERGHGFFLSSSGPGIDNARKVNRERRIGKTLHYYAVPRVCIEQRGLPDFDLKNKKLRFRQALPSTSYEAI